MWLNSDSESVSHNHFNTSLRWEAPWLFPEQPFSFLTSVRVLVNSCDLIPSVHGGLLSTCQPLAWDLEEENRMNARHAFSPPFSLPNTVTLPLFLSHDTSQLEAYTRNKACMAVKTEIILECWNTHCLIESWEYVGCRLLHICQHESKI